MEGPTIEARVCVCVGGGGGGGGRISESVHNDILMSKYTHTHMHTYTISSPPTLIPTQCHVDHYCVHFVQS